MPVSPQQPIVTFFDPNKKDQGLIEFWDTSVSNYVPLDIGTPHPNTALYPNFRLGIQVALPNEDKFVKRVWVSDETNPDWFNYEIKLAEEAILYPTFIRQYRLDRKLYVPKTKLTPLDKVYRIGLITRGTKYIPGTFPAVTFSGGGGSGAVAHAIVNADGTLADIILDDGGSGYNAHPSIIIEDPPSPGVTATGAAFVQPQNALLIAEQAAEFPRDSEFYGLYLNVTRVYETLPSIIVNGEQTGKWGVEPTTRQRVALPGTIDEGYLVRESKIDPESSVVGKKATIFYPSNLYGVALQGQDYDPRLDTIIPFTQKLQPAVYGIGVNREDITPVDYQHSEVRGIDAAIVSAVLNAYVFSYPGRINVDMPDLLTAVYGVIDQSTSDGADQETGTSSLVGNGSIAQTLTAQAQASANILPEAYPIIKQFWGNNIACRHYHFFLANPVTLAQVLSKLNTILSPDTISNWPKFNPEIVTLVMTGGRVSVQSKAHSQGSFATSGSGTASTAAGGVGYSEERGLTVKTLRISPTIHDVINISGPTSGSESVSSSAYAECAGLGPLEVQGTGPLSVYADITPTSIPATQGATSWPTSGLFLYRTDPHPYRYGFIEFHCVVLDAADFPNVP